MAFKDPIEVWHAALRANDLSSFEAILAEDAVFVSPALHKPQAGKEFVSKYLRAAVAVLNNGSFRYTNEWRAERSAVLEFEVTLGELQVNGVDIIHWDEQARVTQFKVMLRPLKALHAVVEKMFAQLSS
jgi:hypothetical protein